MRPLFHFTAPRNWLNDPNGLVWHDGLWHLCYQHNPHGPDWGRLHWGHAVSRDLVTWEHWPIALSEDPAADLMIYSGSLVATTPDGRAPGRERLAAVFTGHFGGGADHWHEHVCLAWSDDGGRTFAMHPGNPVLRGDARKFGDPKVWWDARYGAWYAANISGWMTHGRVVFARSPDLVSWEVCGEFSVPEFAPGVCECPDFFTLPLVDGGTVDVLKVNTWVVTTGAKNVHFFTGRFDGATFHADGSGQRGPTPPGDESYAEVSWDNVPAADGRRLMSGWLPHKPHSSRDYTGVLWLPRELTGVRRADGTVQLRYHPVRELAAHRRETLSHEGRALDEHTTLMPPGGGGPTAVDWELTLDVGRVAIVRVRLGPDLAFVADASARELRLEKPNGVATARWDDPDAPLALRIIVDLTAVDVFTAAGDFAAAATTDVAALAGSLQIEARGAVTLVAAQAWRLA